MDVWTLPEKKEKKGQVAVGGSCCQVDGWYEKLIRRKSRESCGLFWGL